MRTSRRRATARVRRGRTLYVTNRRRWRSWLSKHHATEPEIWLVYYRKDSGKRRISYDGAVLEALCYGWIDSTVRRIDDQRFAQRFSPRKPGSNLSQMNKERVRELLQQRRMTRAGLRAIAHVFHPVRDATEAVVIPKSVLATLAANRDALTHFRRMPESYQRIRLAYLETRKRHGMDVYRKALAHLVRMTAMNKQIGFVAERR